MENPEYSIRHDAKVNIFVGYSHKFDIFSQGRTEEEALKSVKSAESLYAKVTKERGLDLEQVLISEKARKKSFREKELSEKNAKA